MKKISLVFFRNFLNTLFVLLIFFLCMVCERIFASQDGTDARTTQSRTELSERKPTIAIVEFKKSGNISPALEYNLRILINNFIVQTNKYIVVDRSHLEEILKQQQLSSSDMFDSTERVIKMGKLLNAQGIITGNIDMLEGKLHIVLNLIEVQSGRIVNSANISVYSQRYYELACKIVSYHLAKVYIDPKESVIPSDDKMIDTLNFSLMTGNGAYGMFGIELKFSWLLSANIRIGYSQYTDDYDCQFKSLPITFSLTAYPLIKILHNIRPYISIGCIASIKLNDETENTFLLTASIGVDWKVFRIMSLFIEGTILYGYKGHLFSAAAGLKVWIW